MLSERSERRLDSEGGFGSPITRARIATEIAIDVERVVLSPSTAAAYAALAYVLADLGDEVLVASGAEPIASEAAIVSGLDVTPLDALDATALFEAAGERTRLIVLGDRVPPEAVELLAEIELPIVTRDRTIGAHPIFATEQAPLLIVVGDERCAWLAIFGPPDRAEPLLARLESVAPVFFARAGEPLP